MKPNKGKTISSSKKNTAKKGAVSITAPSAKLMQWTAFLAAISFVVFSPALSNEFLNWDDFNYIRDNPAIRSLGIQNLLHIFNFKTFIMGNYHPLTILSYAIEYKLTGLNTVLYHFDNILIHVVNIFLIAHVVWLLTKEFYTSLICAALFAIHPMRVESVVWAAERKDVLYTLFFLLSWLYYIKFILINESKNKHLVISLVFFLCSILSKGQAVVLPFVFLLTDYWYKGKWEFKNIIPLTPYFVLSLVFGLLAVDAQSSSLTEQRLVGLPLWQRILVANYNLLIYPYKLLMPWNLSCFYGYFPQSEMWKIYVAPAGVIVLFAFLFWKFRNNKTIVFGSLFFLSTIFIVIQLLPVGNAIIADRYTYIPYIGLFFIVAKLLNDAITKAKSQTVLTITAVVLLVFSVKSFLYAKTWKSSETIWLNAIEYNDKEPTAYLNLGGHYYDAKDKVDNNAPNRDAIISELREKAFVNYKKCIEHKETFKELFRAYNNIGVYYKDLKKYDLAIQYFDTSMIVAPTYAEGIFNRGLTFNEWGKYDKAIADYTTILTSLDPKSDKAFYSRAITYKNENKIDSAIADYEQCIRVNPFYEGAHTNLGNIYFNKGELDKAIANYTKALQIAPTSGNAWMNRSKAYFLKKDYANALSDANAAYKNGMARDEQYMQILNSPH